MVPWRATPDGHVTPELLAWYQRLAEGRPGALVVEATGISDRRSGRLLRIHHDRFIPGLHELVEVVRAASGGQTRLFIQLIDFLTIRRRPQPQRYFQEFLDLTRQHRLGLARLLHDEAWLEAAPAEVRAAMYSLPEASRASLLTERELEALQMGFRQRVTDLDDPQVRALPDTLPGAFAGSARRAQEAGFDGAELHYAHGYTMASFLSPLNNRGDGYGGSWANRVRLPLEVYAAVRDRVGAGFVVGVRFLADEVVTGGGRIEEACHTAVAFAGAGFDYLSLSKGGKFEDARQPAVGQAAYPYTGPSGAACMPSRRTPPPGPQGNHLPLARAVRRSVRDAGFTTPVVVAGGIQDFQTAEQALRQGDADICAAARQALADPDWLEKVRAGKGAEVRRCELTNYCEGLDQKHRTVTCRLWDRLPLLPDEPPLTDGSRRLVAPRWRPR